MKRRLKKTVVIKSSVRRFVCIVSRSHLLSLFGKHSPTHLQDGLESFPSSYSVFPKAVHARLLDLCADFLQAATEGKDLGVLVEICPPLRVDRRWLVNDGFSAQDQIRPGHVCRAHGDFLGIWVDIGDLVDMRFILATQQRLDPSWCSLLAGDEALCTQDAGVRIYLAREGVDGDDMRGFIVPRALLAPVGRADFFPGVVEGAV